jgi:uncharacterized protein (TIGR03435 family)
MLRVIAILAVCVSALSQQFEVASVKPSSADQGSPSGIRTGNGRLDAHNVTLKRCIIGAYGVGPHQVFGGPDWLDSDRFEILAKTEQPTNDDAALMVILRGLLAERFKLVLHRETRTIPALVLEVAKNGPKLEKAQASEAITNTSSNKSGSSIAARGADMDAFARILARNTDLPVVNHTGLEGIFNLNLQWTRDSTNGGPSIFTALQEQLGLRLRSEKAAVEIIVIDHAEKPSEN